MSHKRELRAAELAVLDAAVACVNDLHWPPPVGTPAHTLLLATNTLAELRRNFDAEAPAAATDTSIRAAREIDPKVGSIRRRVLLEILYRHQRGWGGFTCDALERQLHRPHTTVSSAVNWLMNNGWLRDGGRGTTAAGKSAIIWVPTDAAIREAARLAMEDRPDG